MLLKSLTVQLTELKVNTLSQGKFLLNTIDYIVCDTIHQTLESNVVSEMNVSYNFDICIRQQPINYETRWLSKDAECELLTVNYSLQHFIIGVMERFHTTELKQTHTLNFTIGLVGSNLVVISYSLIGE